VITVSPEQLDGTACVLCGRDFLDDTMPSVPVTLPESGRQVFVCADACRDDPQRE